MKLFSFTLMLAATTFLVVGSHRYVFPNTLQGHRLSSAPAQEINPAHNPHYQLYNILIVIFGEPHDFPKKVLKKHNIGGNSKPEDFKY